MRPVASWSWSSFANLSRKLGKTQAPACRFDLPPPAVLGCTFEVRQLRIGLACARTYWRGVSVGNGGSFRLFADASHNAIMLAFQFATLKRVLIRWVASETA